MREQGTTVVVAIGGNALADPRDPGSLARQDTRATDLARPIADLISAGKQVVLIHGNGPQVGALLMRNETSSENVSPAPLHVCVAETQGQMGHFLDIALVRELSSRGINTPVATILTHVTVDPDAPEFVRPDKPVGPVYDEAAARRLAAERGWQIAPVRGGWRRMVPSPRPQVIVEEPALRTLLAAKVTVIAGGGGGIAVSSSSYQAIDAVVDKDYTAQLVATMARASRLYILTDVPGAAVSFGGDSESFITRASSTEMKAHLSRGQFGPGSMAPKVEACLEFLQHGGECAIIASVDEAGVALSGEAGTIIVPG